jgi:16S rRNA (guanine527-N7)-methyltransferase
MTRLSTALASLRLPLGHEPQLHAFAALLLRWNRAINLSAARTELEIHDHIIDSLHAVPHLQAPHLAPPASSILDVGAGGGLPAVVLAICLPGAHITALEPVHKKHAFLRTAARELDLANLDAFAVRLEDHPRDNYDAALSRATFDLREWLLLGLARVRPAGIVLGFEAVPRDDLPPATRRYPYALESKARAIVALRRDDPVP